MGFIDADTSTFTTGSDSAATFTTKAFTGLLHAIQYVRDSTGTAVSTAVGVTVTAARAGVVFALSPFNSTADVTNYYPRQNIHSTAGSTIAGFEKIPLKDEALTFTLSSGGATKSGVFRTFVE